MAVVVPGKPAYQQIAESLRGDIASGRLPLGQAVGSTAQLMDRFRVSSTVVRKAVEQLRTEGLVVGHPGKGVFVRATPEESAAEAATIADLAAKLDDLRAQLEAIPSKASNDKLTSMGKEIAELRRQVATLQTHLVELYSRVGQPYPHGLTAPEGTGERRIRRA